MQSSNYQFEVAAFDPMSDQGPIAMDKLHINSVHCNRHGMYISGHRTGGMLHFNGKQVRMAVTLPAGSNDARPFRDGVIFNDTEADTLRYTGRGEGEEDRAMPIPACTPHGLQHTDAITDGVARVGFARGLAVLSERIVVGGSSPATVALYDLAANETLGSVRLSPDVRNSIHSIGQWPFG